MTSEHKEALAIGRDQGRVVRHYLEAIQQQRPKRGRKRTVATAERQLAEVNKQLESANPLMQLQLEQRRMDLAAELSSHGQKADLTALEKEFVAVAREYGERKGVTYKAWTAVGVSPAILREAGITK